MNHESDLKPQTLDSITNNHNPNPDLDLFDYWELQCNEEEAMELEFGFGSEPVGHQIIDLDFGDDNEENNPGRVDNDSGLLLLEEVDWEEVENRAYLTTVIDELTDDDNNDNYFYYYNDFDFLDYNNSNDLLLEDELMWEFGDRNDVVLPAAKRVVENLPVVEVGDGGGVGCAVCTEEIGVGEKAIRLPCVHYYHGECIGPWLAIRNTCPVCRYELPTDDPEYERRRKLRGLRSVRITPD